MDQYLGDVREIERRIQKAAQQASTDLTLPDAPAGAPKDVEEHIKLMFDLQVLAWQADITRVTTMLLAKELSNAVYAKSGVRDAFHILSHHSNIRENQDRFAVLNRYHVGLLAYLLDKLQAIPDGDGTLLDHSMVLYGSAMSDGNQHNHGPLPIILAGGASGRLAGRPPHPQRAGHDDVEPAAGDARQARRAHREVRRQHGHARDLSNRAGK